MMTNHLLLMTVVMARVENNVLVQERMNRMKWQHSFVCSWIWSVFSTKIKP